MIHGSAKFCFVHSSTFVKNLGKANYVACIKRIIFLNHTMEK